jgi:hypothetical protein
MDHHSAHLLLHRCQVSRLIRITPALLHREEMGMECHHSQLDRLSHLLSSLLLLLKDIHLLEIIILLHNKASDRLHLDLVRRELRVRVNMVEHLFHLDMAVAVAVVINTADRRQCHGDICQDRKE